MQGRGSVPLFDRHIEGVADVCLRRRRNTYSETTTKREQIEQNHKFHGHDAQTID